MQIRLTTALTREDAHFPNILILNDVFMENNVMLGAVSRVTAFMKQATGVQIRKQEINLKKKAEPQQLTFAEAIEYAEIIAKREENVRKLQEKLNIKGEWRK